MKNEITLQDSWADYDEADPISDIKDGIKLLGGGKKCLGITIKGAVEIECLKKEGLIKYKENES